MQIEMLRVDEIRRNPWNSRVASAGDPDVVELSESIRAEGVQQAIKVRSAKCEVRSAEGAGGGARYEIVFGERRWMACAVAGLELIPVVVEEMEDSRVMTLMALENLQRRDLGLLESASSVRRLFDLGWTAEQVGEHLGKSSKWVARRAQLTRLTPRWIELVGDPKQAVSSWSGGHLELIARLGEGMQDELAGRYAATEEWSKEQVGDYYEVRDMTVEDLRRETGRLCMTVDGAPWKTADETLVVEAGSCDACRKRSDCQAELFDELDWEEAGDRRKKKEKRGVRCLDASCWGRKLEAHLKVKESELRVKSGGDVVLVGNEHEAEGTPFGGRVVDAWELQECKKSEAGATPALVVSGSKAGTTYYVKPTSKAKSGGGSGSGSTLRGQKPKGKTVAEKMFEWEWKRLKIVVGKLGDLFEGIHEGKLEVPGHLTLRERLGFVLAFGTRERESNLFYQYSGGKFSEVWGKYLKAVSGGVDGVEGVDLVDGLFRQGCGVAMDLLRVLGRMASREIGEKRGLESKRVACGQLCGVLGLSWESEWESAREALPYPRSWRAEAEKKEEKKGKDEGGRMKDEVKKRKEKTTEEATTKSAKGTKKEKKGNNAEGAEGIAEGAEKKGTKGTKGRAQRATKGKKETKGTKGTKLAPMGTLERVSQTPRSEVVAKPKAKGKESAVQLSEKHDCDTCVHNGTREGMEPCRTCSSGRVEDDHWEGEEEEGKDEGGRMKDEVGKGKEEEGRDPTRAVGVGRMTMRRGIRVG